MPYLTRSHSKTDTARCLREASFAAVIPLEATPEGWPVGRYVTDSYMLCHLPSAPAAVQAIFADADDNVQYGLKGTKLVAQQGCEINVSSILPADPASLEAVTLAGGNAITGRKGHKDRWMVQFTRTDGESVFVDDELLANVVGERSIGGEGIREAITFSQGERPLGPVVVMLNTTSSHQTADHKRVETVTVTPIGLVMPVRVA